MIGRLQNKLLGAVIVVMVLLSSMAAQLFSAHRISHLSDHLIDITIPHAQAMHEMRDGVMTVLLAAHELMIDEHVASKKSRADFIDGVAEFRAAHARLHDISDHDEYLQYEEHVHSTVMKEVEAKFDVLNDLIRKFYDLHADGRQPDRKLAVQLLGRIESSAHGIIGKIDSLIDEEVSEGQSHLAKSKDTNDFLFAFMAIFAVATSLVIVGYIVFSSILLRERERYEQELRHKNAELLNAATHDPLTMLHNRRYFFETAEAYAAASRRHTAEYTVGVIDIDFFKRVNDTYGHQAGDAVLMNLARLLQDSVHRTNDIVARFGGEEFCLFLFGTGLEDARQLFESIRKLVEKTLVRIDGHDISIEISIGGYSSKGRNIDEALKLADDNLYRAKREGRNRVIVSGDEGGESGKVNPDQ